LNMPDRLRHQRRGRCRRIVGPVRRCVGRWTLFPCRDFYAKRRGAAAGRRVPKGPVNRRPRCHQRQHRDQQRHCRRNKRPLPAAAPLAAAWCSLLRLVPPPVGPGRRRGRGPPLPRVLCPAGRTRRPWAERDGQRGHRRRREVVCRDGRRVRAHTGFPAAPPAAVVGQVRRARQQEGVVAGGRVEQGVQARRLPAGPLRRPVPLPRAQA